MVMRLLFMTGVGMIVGTVFLIRRMLVIMADVPTGRMDVIMTVLVVMTVGMGMGMLVRMFVFAMLMLVGMGMRVLMIVAVFMFMFSGRHNIHLLYGALRKAALIKKLHPCPHSVIPSKRGRPV